MNPYDMIYDLNDVVNELTQQLEVAKASLSKWESVFGHLGTPDEVGNEWVTMSDRLEVAEKERLRSDCDALRVKVETAENDAAHQKALADSALRVAEGWERKCGELRAALQHETDCVEAAKAEIEALRAKIEAMEKQEPAKHEFQGRDGVWYPFINQRHYENTVADGSWPVRALYALPDAEEGSK